MIIKQTHEIVESNTNLKTMKFGIDDGADVIPLLINFLSGLYPEPKLTIQNEYMSNARDSHVDAGCPDTPVEITLPNKLNPYYAVRDFGIGMTDDQVENIYTKALKSTKRNSNGTIGGFGVGKLVFSQYNMGVMIMTTWIDGIQTIYQCRLKDGDGEIIEIMKTKSDEPRGVEIKIEILEEDFAMFHNNSKYLYAFYKTPPVVKGIQDFKFDHKYLVKTDRFSVLSKSIEGAPRGSLATIGDVPFPLSTSSFYNKLSYAEQNILNDYPFVMHFDVGEVSHTPARDSLEYNDATVTAITTRLAEFRIHLAKMIQDEITGITSIWEARCVHAELYDNTDPHYKIAKAFKLMPKVKFDDVPYTCEIKNTDIKKKSALYVNHVNYRDKMSRSNVYELKVRRDMVLLVDTNELSEMKRKRRIKHYINTQNSGMDMTTVELEAGVTIQEFADELGAPMTCFIDIATLDDPAVAARSHTGYARESRKGKVLECCINFHADFNVHAWSETNIDFANDTGVYIAISRYKPADYECANSAIRDAFKYLRTVDTDFKLYGIKKAEIKKAEDNPNMVSIEEYVATLTKKLRSEIGTDHLVLDCLADIIDKTHLATDNSRLSRNIEDIKCPQYNHYYTTIQRYANALKNVDKTKVDLLMSAHNTLAHVTGEERILRPSKVNPNVLRKAEKIMKMRNSIQHNYPLIGMMPNTDNQVEYINAMSFYKKHGKGLTAAFKTA